MYPPINEAIQKTVRDNYDELKSLPKLLAYYRLKKLCYGDKSISIKQSNEITLAVIKIAVANE